MTFAEESSVLERPSFWSDWKQRHLQKRYWGSWILSAVLPWILSAVLPFILLQLVLMYEIGFPFQSPVSLSSVEHIEHGQFPAPAPDVKSKTSPDSPPFIRPDEDAWVIHNDWINHDLNPHGGKRKEEDQVIRNGNDNSTEFVEPFSSTTRKGGNFGLPEDDEKEESESEASDMIPKGEERTEENPTAAEETSTAEQATPEGQCDLFEGEWEHDPEGALYTNSTCSYIQDAQNCMRNGRPDTEYLYWRWKPRDCDLPRFDAKSFMDSFRGKAIGFLGDSIARNQMQSLLCLLSQVEIPVRTYVSADDKTVRYLFTGHQVTLGVVWSSYLLKESKEGVMGFEEGQSVLFLDELDTSWTSVMTDFDIIVFLFGQWYYKSSVYISQGKVIGCHICPSELNLTEIGYYQAYGKGTRQVLEKVSNQFKGVAIMSTFPLSHFENGTSDTGGNCQRELPLEVQESQAFPGDHNKMRGIVVDEFQSVITENRGLGKDARLEIVDVTRVSLQRADGHPGTFSHPIEGRDPHHYYPNDCMHWCLPGPVDAWNQLAVEIVEKYL